MNMAVMNGALAALAGALFAGAAAAQSTIDIEVCNNSRDDALVAISYQPVGAGKNDWLNVGWYTVRRGKCSYIASTQNAYFYGYAEVDGDGSRFWGGNHSLCVEYPGPYEFWSDQGKRCKRYQNAVSFQTLHADYFGTFTWHLDP